MRGGASGVLAVLCPCLGGEKETEDESGGDTEKKKKKVQISEYDQDGSPIKTNRGHPDEITFDRRSNASSLHQIPSLYTELEVDANKETVSHSGRAGEARSNISRYSVDDVGSYRSTLRIDRTPSLSFCSEMGVAKSSSILVNVPSSRASLSSFGRLSSSRRSSPERRRRRGSLTSSTTTDANATSSRHNLHFIDIKKDRMVTVSPSWSAKTSDSIQRKCS